MWRRPTRGVCRLIREDTDDTPQGAPEDLGREPRKGDRKNQWRELEHWLNMASWKSEVQSILTRTRSLVKCLLKNEESVSFSSKN